MNFLLSVCIICPITFVGLAESEKNPSESRKYEIRKKDQILVCCSLKVLLWCPCNHNRILLNSIGRVLFDIHKTADRVTKLMVI